MLERLVAQEMSDRLGKGRRCAVLVVTVGATP